MLEGMVQDIFNLSFIKPHKHFRYGWAALIDFEQNNIDYSKWDNIKKDSVVFFLKKTYGGVEYRWPLNIDINMHREAYNSMIQVQWYIGFHILDETTIV